MAILSLLSFSGLLAGSFGTAGCLSQCDALCVATASASGAIDVPANKPDLKITFCINTECHEDTLSFGAAGGADCQGEVQCLLTENASGATLKISRSWPPVDMEVGDVIHVTIENADTGDVLVDSTQSVDEIIDEELCGTTCHSAAVSWDS